MRIMKENDENTLKAKAWYTDTLNGVLDHTVNNFALCLLDGTLIGTVGYFEQDDHYVITLFHIDQKYQNQGYGSQLLSEIEAMIAEHRPCTIKVGTGYEKAIGFYQKNGYEIVAVIPRGFYQKQGHEVVALIPAFYPSDCDKTILQKIIT